MGCKESNQTKMVFEAGAILYGEIQYMKMDILMF